MKSKKNFTGGLASLLGEAIPAADETAAASPKVDRVGKEITKTSQIGTKDQETRATFIVNEGALEKIKAIAYWERMQIKDVISAAFEAYLASYEKKAGPLQPIPRKK